MYLLLHGGQPLAAGQRLDVLFPHLEEIGDAAVRALPTPRLIKTHLAFERVPWHAEAKYLYVARNPFDCAVSFYHHTRGFPKHYDFADGTWDAFFECFVRGEVDFGDYFDHLMSWWPKRTAPNVLFLTYERMLDDPAAAVQAIARFLGGDAPRVVAEPGHARARGRAEQLRPNAREPAPLVERAPGRHAGVRAQRRRRRLGQLLLGCPVAAAGREAAGPNRGVRRRIAVAGLCKRRGGNPEVAT